MKKMLAKFLSLTLCAAMLCAVPAFAAETAAKPARLGPVRVWGRMTRLESGSLFLKNDNPNDPNREIIVHLSGETCVLDAASGLPMDPAKLREGEVVYAWVGPAMTMSLPPQATAKVIVANIPADFGVPMYHQVAAVKPQPMHAIFPVPALTKVELVDTNGGELTITDQAQLQPHMTRNIIRLEMLRPGTEMMVWKDYGGTVTKVLVFPYAYKGCISWTEDGKVTLNDQCLPVSGKLLAPPATPIAALRGPEMLLPVRAVAEELGLDVRWDAGKGAVVAQGGADLFAAMPGGAILRFDSEGKAEEAFGTCVVENGVTYLSAGTLVSLLNLFIAG